MRIVALAIRVVFHFGIIQWAKLTFGNVGCIQTKKKTMGLHLDF